MSRADRLSVSVEQHIKMFGTSPTAIYLGLVDMEELEAENALSYTPAISSDVKFRGISVYKVIHIRHEYLAVEVPR